MHSRIVPRERTARADGSASCRPARCSRLQNPSDRRTQAAKECMIEAKCLHIQYQQLSVERGGGCPPNAELTAVYASAGSDARPPFVVG